MVLLSVIIPTFNSEKTIERCLNSLVFQTFQEFELCVVDGGSTDQTLSLINYFHLHFKNIRIISEPDNGTYDAMNKGVSFSQGQWLYFLGSDDQLYDEGVFMDIFQKDISREIGIVYGNVYVSGDTSWAKSGCQYDGYFDLDKLMQKNICHQAMFYRRELFEKFGKYNTKYLVCADWEMNLRLFPKTKFIYRDRLIAIFHGGGLSTREKTDPISSDLETIKKRALREHKIRSLNPFLSSSPTKKTCTNSTHEQF